MFHFIVDVKLNFSFILKRRKSHSVLDFSTVSFRKCYKYLKYFHLNKVFIVSKSMRGIEMMQNQKAKKLSPRDFLLFKLQNKKALNDFVLGVYLC